MHNKKGIGIGLIVGIVIVLLVAGYFVLYSNHSSNGEGRVVFGITDAAADMGSVTEVKVTVDEIQAHSETEGWITISSSSQTYDLLELKNENKVVVLKDAMLKSGTYTQTRLVISKVMIVDEEGEHEAKLPSNEVKIVGDVVVEENLSSAVTFDFIADESLHITGNGEYIMAPVIQLESRSNVNISINSANELNISGGRVVASTKTGMDIEGKVGVGLRIPSNANLGIGSNGKVQLGI